MKTKFFSLIYYSLFFIIIATYFFHLFKNEDIDMVVAGDQPTNGVDIVQNLPAAMPQVRQRKKKSHTSFKTFFSTVI